MIRFGEPFRIYTLREPTSGKRHGRYRKRREADAAVQKLIRKGVAVSSVPSQYWYVDVRRPGCRNTLRCTEASNLEEAKAVIDSWRVAARKEEEARAKENDHAEAGGPPKPRWRPIGFEEAAKLFLEAKELEGLTAKTLSEYRHLVEHRFEPAFGKRMLHAVEPEDIQEYFKDRNTPGPSGKKPSRDLLRHERMVLRQLYKWAIIRRYVISDPTLGIKIEKPLPAENRILDFDEAAALLKACKEPYYLQIRALRNTGGKKGGTVTESPKAFSQKFTPPPWLHDIVVLALSTGLRLGNLVGLLWEHVDLKRQRIDLPAVSMKNRRALTVFLNQDSHEILKRRSSNRDKNDEGLVFPALDNRTVQRSFEKAVQRAEIKPCHFHDLRKTCASWLAAAGVNLNAVMAVTGHRTLDVTLRHYLAVTEDQRRSAVEKIKLPSL